MSKPTTPPQCVIRTRWLILSVALQPDRTDHFFSIAECRVDHDPPEPDGPGTGLPYFTAY